jgi:hypothetical protein
MIEKDFKTFAESWATAYEMYGKTASPAVTAGAFSLLSEYSLDQVLEGIGAHLKDPKHGSFLPKPGDVVRHIQAADENEAMAALGVVKKMINPYLTPVFDDPRTAAGVAAMGGWKALGEMTTREWDSLVPRFIEGFYSGEKPAKRMLRGIVQEDMEERIANTKPELVERFGHGTIAVNTTGARRLN